MATEIAAVFAMAAASAYCASWAANKKRLSELKRRIENPASFSSFSEKEKQAPGFSVFGAVDEKIRGFSVSEIVRRELSKANLSLKVSEFMVISFLCAAIPGLLVATLSDRKELAVMLSALGCMFPVLYLKQKQAARRKMFAGQLLDAITIISNSLKSGYSFAQALDLVAREMPPPISEETQKLLKELKLGIPFEEAVDRMTGRVCSDDFDLIMTGVKIQREVGGNLTEILDKIAHTIRERTRIKGQIQTLTAQGRLSGLILGLLPVVLGFFLYAVNPDYMLTLATRPAGRMMVLFAIVSQIVGIFILKKIIDIKV